jgi:predicted esterase
MNDREWLLRRGLPLSRRRFLRAGLGGAGGFAALACGGSTFGQQTGSSRLTVRPHAPTRTIAPGTHDIGDAVNAECTLFVPESYRPDSPAGLFVALHGAGSSRNYMDGFFGPAADYDQLVLVPKSAGRTWDLMLGGFGIDVHTIDRALEHTFTHCNIDPSGVTIAGFSDGASYALSLGLDNGDLFTRLVAFSAGYIRPENRIGRPAVYMVHGTRDAILPIDSTSRRIAGQLRAWEYNITYREFDGPHTVRIEDVRAAFDWITAPRPALGQG